MREEEVEKEEQRIQQIMSALDRVASDAGRINSESLDRIVGVEDIAREMSKYKEKSDQLELEKAGEMGGSVEQMHRRLVAALNRQIEAQTRKHEEIAREHAALLAKVEAVQQALIKAQRYNQHAEKEIEKLDVAHAEDTDMDKLKRLVQLNESLKAQEQEFRAQCKRQLQEFKEKIATLQQELNSGEMKSYREAAAAFEEDVHKMEKVRALLAKKNRDVTLLQRQIDEIPTRTELIQYEKRFRELYDQVVHKLKETKKYFDEYNTLEETRTFLAKEMSLLNSIHGNFQSCQNSKAGKGWLVEQVATTLSGLQKSKSKLTEKLEQERAAYNVCNEKLSQLLSKQRAYFKAVKEFKEECSKNEILEQKLKERTARAQ